MTDVFISYSQQDRKLVASLAKQLQRNGYSVWWDHRLQAGDEFRDTIVKKINEAKVSIVVWSPKSVESSWVRSEAEIARALGTLVPVHVPRLDATSVPPPFGVLHSIDISDTSSILGSLSSKIELDDATRARIAAQRQRRRRTKLVVSGALGLTIAASVVTWFASPAFRTAITGSAQQAYYRLFPCDDLTVFVNVEGQERRLCIPPSEQQAFRDCSDCPQMVALHGGRFVIGSPEREPGRDVDEQQTEVEVPGFAIGQYEITVEQWKSCVYAGACQPRQAAEISQEKHPASSLSWDDTQSYINWLNSRTARNYRLPTEAEWEFAARASTIGPRPWGHVPSKACEYANVNDLTHQRAQQTAGMPGAAFSGAQDSHTCDDSYPHLAPVGEFKANDFGLYDVIGNVWEWVEDCTFPNYDALPRDGSAYAPGDCQVRMLRGGSFKSGPASARSANRFQGGRDRSNAQPDFGFRVARDLK